MNREENLKTIYNDAVELGSQQQAAIDLVYNKFNWVLVADVVLLAALYAKPLENLFVILVVSLSAIATLVGFESRQFGTTEQIESQLKRAEEKDFLEGLIKKKQVAFNKNAGGLKMMTFMLKCSSRLLIAAVAVQSFILVTNLQHA